jgi:hypothetical protein
MFYQRWQSSIATDSPPFPYPDNKARANERAGFIDAPDINAKKGMSKPTIPPKPLKPFACATNEFTVTSKAEAYDLMIVARHD